jgi:major membrane immunogen (membrane-anchored lipoprotein)
MKNTIPVLLTVLLLLSACGQSGTKESADKSGNTNQEPASYKPEKSTKVVARVNGVPIYEDELNGRPVDSLITDEILYQKGLKEGLEKKYQDKIREYQMSLVVRELKGAITDKTPPEREITEKDLLDYYNSNKDLNYTNYRIEEINFQDEKWASKIKMAKEGKSFQDIAKDLSNAESQVTVKDLGFKKLNIYFHERNRLYIRVIRKQDGHTAC